MSRGGSPGLTLSRQAPAVAIATVGLEGPPSALWEDLAGRESFQAALVDAALDAAQGRTLDEYLDVLEEHGVDALTGRYRTLLARTARGDRRAMWDLLEQTRRLGSGRSSLDDVLGAARLFTLTDETPTVAVRLSHDFRDLRAQQRRAVCALLATLAQGCDVRVVASGLLQRWLVENHRTDLPVSREDVTPPSGGALASRVEAARAALDPEGREVSLLRALADEEGETLTYHALYSTAHVSRSRVRQAVGQLVDLELVATFEGVNGRGVELLPGGRALLETIDEEIGRQETLGNVVTDSYSETEAGSGRVCGTGQPSGSPVYTAPAHEAAPQEEPADRPRPRFDATYLSRWHHAAAAGSAVDGGVTLVDAPIDALEDGREPGWSFDGQQLVVAAEYGHSALQWWVRTALALANWRTFEHVLAPDVLDDVLAEHPRAVLLGARNLGFLKDENADGEAYADALQDAAEHLRELTKKRHHGEFSDRRKGASIITRDALGLATLMVHLLDLAGVDVVRELRLPECSRNYDAEDRAEIAESIAIGLAQQSTYAGHHVAYRHLFESREDKRKAALAVDVDAADPLGEPIGSWVVVGPGADALEGAVRRAVRNPADLHDDAPEFGVSVRIGTPGRPAVATAAKRALDSKNLDVTREAVSVLEAFTGSAYAAAEALHALATEDLRREVRLDEIRLALGSLPASLLLPDAAPTVSKVVRALLRSDAPMNQAELAEAANVSTRSIRRHADRLAAFDLLRETGDGYRLALSHRGERYRDVLPWFAVPNAERDDYRDATEKGVLWDAIDADLPGAEAVLSAVARVDGLRLPDGVREAVLDSWPWARALLAAIRALAAEELEHREPGGRTVTFGAEIEQASLVAEPSASGRAAT